MTDDPITIDRAPERVSIAVRGHLDARLAAAFRERLAAALQGPPVDLLVDLRALTDYDEAGADALLRAHESLADRARRSAYLVERPRIRGLVFKLIHGTQDERTRPVATLEMADAWFRAPTEHSFAEASLDRARTLLDRFRAKLAVKEAAPR